jgi:polyhydroxyalkanoate synthase
MGGIVIGAHSGLQAADWQRRLAGHWLEAWLSVPEEAPFRARPLMPGCDLLSYGGNGSPVLIVPAPIKRPYIWDLFPGASTVRRLLQLGFSVHMLRWTEDTVETGAGLEFFAASGPGEALRRLSPGRVILAGHSLGGLFAAMTACLFPDVIRGMVLIETPLVFKEHRLGSAAKAAPLLQPLLNGELTGTALSALSVALMPDEFLWRRWSDGALSLGDPHRMRLHLGVLRWALDEFPLPSPLVMELLAMIADDAFVSEKLSVGGQTIGPAAMRVPVLAVTCGSALTPLRALTPFFESCGRAESRIIQFPIDAGIALPHVSPLVGPAAQAQLWPNIAAWAQAAGEH